MELLAPAGGFSQLEAAIKFGADAVYLAADRFGMRARATNFALSDIPRAVSIAHEAGVAVHVTCNILMNDADLRELPAYLSALDEAGVDALIISDLGALRLARTWAPHCEYHVSTQASVSNVQAALAWHDMGARRVVCAREMSLVEISAMKAALPADMKVEAFAHGSMCMAVSGRCLISSYLTGRSGNKGHCTQPCRWMYTLEEEKRPGQHFPIEEDETGTFIMNAQDLNMLAHVREMQQAGIDSIKIEGRNKKAFYVATIVNAYRQVLDGADPAAFAEELETVSHRPYSTGFFFGPAHQSVHTDGYEQTCLHVADIVACEPVGDEAAGGEVAGGAVAGGAMAAGSASELGAPAPVLSPVSDGEASDAGAAGESGSVNDVSFVADEGAAGGLYVASPASAPAGGDAPSDQAPQWRITVVCHNRFAQGDTLEALVPRVPPFEVRIDQLVWLSETAAGEELPQSVEVANRAMARYTFVCNRPLEVGGFLRLREHRVTSRYA